MPKSGDIEVRTYGRYVWIACADCSVGHWVRLVKNQPRSTICHPCAAKRAGKAPRTWMIGERNHRWKRGWYKKSDGYIMTRIQPDDPLWPMTQKSKYTKARGQIAEHRLNMARHLGRCLKPWEIVHHINGLKDDNRIENLMLLPSATDHLVDTETKAYIARLEAEVERLSSANVTESSTEVTE